MNMSYDEKRQAAEMLVKYIEALSEEKQQFILGYIAGVSARQGDKKSA